MIGFLKARSLKNAADRQATGGNALPAGQQSEEPGSGRVDEVKEKMAPIEAALTNEPVSFADRYEIRESPDGWFVYDNQTRATAETYGYRLMRMNRPRAESLAEVLNRGEVRKRGRNG